MADINERNDASAWDAFVSFDGVVRSVVSFGAFVEVAPGVEGLVHESLLEQPVRPGDQMRVRLERLDVEARRLSLAPAS